MIICSHEEDFLNSIDINNTYTILNGNIIK